MKEVPLGASVSQDRVIVSADNESMLVTTAVAMQKISFIMAIAEEHTTSQYNIISHHLMQIPIMLDII